MMQRDMQAVDFVNNMLAKCISNLPRVRTGLDDVIDYDISKCIHNLPRVWTGLYENIGCDISKCMPLVQTSSYIYLF